MGNIVRKMSSTTSSANEETTPLMADNSLDIERQVEQEMDEFLKFKHKKTEEEEVEKETKKRKIEDNISTNILTEVFLRIFYPISSCMTKTVSAGVMKSLDYSPTVILNHGSKMVTFTESSWESFMKHIHLLECYLSNNTFGRRTRLSLLESNIEVDIVKHRGGQMVRFRDLTRHDVKLHLTKEEFYTLSCTTGPVTRYLKQLIFSSAIIKDYLIDTLDKQPFVPILYGPVDTSIFNRIPQEVEMWRQLNNYHTNFNIDEVAQEVKEEEQSCLL